MAASLPGAQVSNRDRSGPPRGKPTSAGDEAVAHERLLSPAPPDTVVCTVSFLTPLFAPSPTTANALQRLRAEVVPPRADLPRVSSDHAGRRAIELVDRIAGATVMANHL